MEDVLISPNMSEWIIVGGLWILGLALWGFFFWVMWKRGRLE